MLQPADALDLTKTGPGAFRLINIDGSHGGTSPQILADWMLNGYEGYMPLDWYFSDPGRSSTLPRFKPRYDPHRQ